MPQVEGNLESWEEAANRSEDCYCGEKKEKEIFFFFFLD